MTGPSVTLYLLTGTLLVWRLPFGPYLVLILVQDNPYHLPVGHIRIPGYLLALE